MREPEEWQEDEPIKIHPDTVRRAILKTKKNGDARNIQPNIEYRDERITFAWDYESEVL